MKWDVSSIGKKSLAYKYFLGRRRKGRETQLIRMKLGSEFAGQPPFGFEFSGIFTPQRGETM